MENYFGKGELLFIVYNFGISYFTYRLVTNIPSIKMSKYLSYIYLYYCLMGLYLGALGYGIWYIETNYNGNNYLDNFLLKLERQQQLHNLINYTTIVNIVDCIVVLILFICAVISNEYYDSQISNNQLDKTTNKINGENQDEEEDEEDDEDDEDEEDAEEDDEDEEDDEEDDEDEEKEEKEDKDDKEENNENKGDDKEPAEPDESDEEYIPELICTEPSPTNSTNSSDFKNNLSEECIDEIKKILFNSDSRQIRLLVRTINKHLNN